MNVNFFRVTFILADRLFSVVCQNKILHLRTGNSE